MFNLITIIITIKWSLLICIIPKIPIVSMLIYSTWICVGCFKKESFTFHSFYWSFCHCHGWWDIVYRNKCLVFSDFCSFRYIVFIDLYLYDISIIFPLPWICEFYSRAHGTVFIFTPIKN